MYTFFKVSILFYWIASQARNDATAVGALDSMHCF